MMKKVIQRSTYTLLYIFSLLPWWAVYFFSELIFIVLHYIFGYRKRIIEENLRNAFPEKTDLERKQIQRKFTRYLSELLFETIKLFTISETQVKNRVAVRNAAYVEQFLRNGRSVIGVLGHYGNWEIAGMRYSQLFQEKRLIVYKPLTDKYFDKIMFKMRSRFGATPVSMKQTLRKLIQYKNESTVTVLVGDQTPAKSEVNYYTKFLNQPTAVFLGVEKLAKLTNSVVVFCDIRRVKRGYYTCDFVPLVEDPRITRDHEITKKHVQYLEKVIQDQPEYWLWSHRRWKYKPEEFNQIIID